MTQTPDNIVSFPDRHPSATEEHGLGYYLRTNPDAGLKYFVREAIEILSEIEPFTVSPPDKEVLERGLSLVGMQVEMARRCLHADEEGQGHEDG